MGRRVHRWGRCRLDVEWAEASVKIIDPEFAVYGPPGLDVRVAGARHATPRHAAPHRTTAKRSPRPSVLPSSNPLRIPGEKAPLPRSTYRYLYTQVGCLLSGYALAALYHHFEGRAAAVRRLVNAICNVCNVCNGASPRQCDL